MLTYRTKVFSSDPSSYDAEKDRELTELAIKEMHPDVSSEVSVENGSLKVEVEIEIEPDFDQVCKARNRLAGQPVLRPGKASVDYSKCLRHLRLTYAATNVLEFNRRVKNFTVEFYDEE